MLKDLNNVKLFIKTFCIKMYQIKTISYIRLYTYIVHIVYSQDLQSM